MTEYIIKGEEQKKKPVEVYLRKDTDGIILMVGEWCVFSFNLDGTGHIYIGISKDNEVGLQVDEDGRIVLK